MNTKERYNGETLAMLIADERETNLFIIEEGTGDNLLDEDIDNGYIDYVNWTMHTLKMDDVLPIFVEADGGMVLSKEYVCDRTIESICKDICEDFGSANATFLVYDTADLTI